MFGYEYDQWKTMSDLDYEENFSDINQDDSDIEYANALEVLNENSKY